MLYGMGVSVGMSIGVCVGVGVSGWCIYCGGSKHVQCKWEVDMCFGDELHMVVSMTWGRGIHGV